MPASQACAALPVKDVDATRIDLQSYFFARTDGEPVLDDGVNGVLAKPGEDSEPAAPAPKPLPAAFTSIAPDDSHGDTARKNMCVAKHVFAKAFIDLTMREAVRRRTRNARP